MASLDDYIAGRATFQEAMQGVRGGPVERLSDVPQVAGPPNALAPYKPSPLDRVRNALLSIGAPQRTAEGAANLLDFLPGVGDAEGAYQAGREGAAGNVLGAAIIGGATLAGLPSGKARALADLLPSERKAQEILDLLKSGRASEVTDDMLGALDANGQAYLFENYDLPMDAASREARARSSGYNMTSETYHATDDAFPAFDLDKAGTGANAGNRENAVFLAADAPAVDGYLGGAYVKAQPGAADMGGGVGRYYNEGSNVLPTRVRTDRMGWWDMGGGGYSADEMRSMLRDAKRAKETGLVLQDVKDPGIMTLGSGKRTTIVAASDPRDIRSRFARFDPRLSHLRDLLAGLGVGTAGLYGATNALMPQQDEGAY